MKTAVLTTSWDDGHRYDVRLARMLKKHGLAATFYVAPQNQEFTEQDLLTSQEVRDLSRDFEIGGHSITHRRLATISEQQAEKEIVESKSVLEQMTGKEVKAFCYPGGVYTQLHVQLVKYAGYRYARTTARYAFAVDSPYEAGTSLQVYNHRFDLLRTARFAKFQPIKVLRYLEWDALARAMFDRVIKEGGVYHIWGHSWEIDEYNYWERLENVFSYISGRELKIGRSTRHDHGQVASVALDPSREAISQVGDRLKRQQRILGQRVIYRDRTPTEARREYITVQPEHRTCSNSGHTLTLPRAAPA